MDKDNRLVIFLWIELKDILHCSIQYQKTYYFVVNSEKIIISLNRTIPCDLLFHCENYLKTCYFVAKYDKRLQWPMLRDILHSIDVTLPPSAPTYVTSSFSNLFTFWPAGDPLVVLRGATHISCHYKNTIEGAGENRRTNEQTRTMLGVNSEQKKSYATLCIPDSIYGLTLAWVTSENSTKQLECRLILTRSSFTGPYLLCYCVWSRLPLSVVSRQLPLSFFLQPTLFRVPLPLPDTARFQVQKPFVWFRAKTDKWIVCLAGHLYTVTLNSAKWLFPLLQIMPNDFLLCCD